MNRKELRAESGELERISLRGLGDTRLPPGCLKAISDHVAPLFGLPFDGSQGKPDLLRSLWRPSWQAGRVRKETYLAAPLAKSAQGEPGDYDKNKYTTNDYRLSRPDLGPFRKGLGREAISLNTSQAQ